MDRTPTYNPRPSAPRLQLPPGACDTHVHIFGPAARFPFAASSAINPADATKEMLFALHRKLGIDRCVIVQSLVHGLDNRVVEDAIAVGGGRYLGVSLVALDASDAELARLAAAGIRGARFHFMTIESVKAGVADVLAFSRRLAPLGMHLQLHFESEVIHALAPQIVQSAVPVVIDHMARVDAMLGPQHRDFVALRELMQDPLMRVKVSGIDRISKQRDYADGIALARMLVEEFPERCLWGTDWPHPNHDHVPDDGVLVDALAQIAPEVGLREQLLVRNPRDFYRFEA